MEFHHVSVLLEETIGALLTDLAGTYVDCTLGGGGHGYEVASRLQPLARFVGLDQDAEAIKASRIKLSSVLCRVDLVQSNFQYLDKVLDGLNIELVEGILFDLGVSSYQLDCRERGFSYMHDGPLDMRMNADAKFSAFDVVNGYQQEKLAMIIAQYGEERWAQRIAQFIVQQRIHKPITSTAQLVEIIKKAIPAGARKDGPHPAKRTFQAIRIEVNNELGILRQAIVTAVNRLKRGGRLCVITFHSLEDRIVKQTLQELAKSCSCPPKLPICTCNTTPKIKVLGKSVLPSENEVLINPRSRSAKLRVAEKL